MGVYKSCVLSVFSVSFDVRHFLCLFFDSSLSCAPEPPVSRLGHRQRHSEMFAVSKLHPESFLGQWLDVSLTEQNVFSAFHTINNCFKQKCYHICPLGINGTMIVAAMLVVLSAFLSSANPVLRIF